jgi:heme exporter protein C
MGARFNEGVLHRHWLPLLHAFIARRTTTRRLRALLAGVERTKTRENGCDNPAQALLTRLAEPLAEIATMPEALASPQGAASGNRAIPIATALLLFGTVLLLVGSYLGIAWAPPEHYMGNVQRIMYVHVPTAWNGLLAFTTALVAAIGFLLRPSWKWDALLEASLEVGVLLSLMLITQGSIWAKPTWGVWWDWDPRLTTVAVMLFAFGGIVALRTFVTDPVRRATWSAVATIVAYADVPIVYFSVRWWNSLHQVQSSPSTVDPHMVLPLRINAFGVLFFASGLMVLRSLLASRRRAAELAPPPGMLAAEAA